MQLTDEQIAIIGSSGNIKINNLGLLIRAIEFVTGKKDLGSIYFEGASLYDILNLIQWQEKKTSDISSFAICAM